MKNDSFGDRMKAYETIPQVKLMRKSPVIIRLDGKSFSKFTKGLAKPFDEQFNSAMVTTAKLLCENIQGAVFAYTQSDEIQILLQDWETYATDAWFDYKVQKMTSISASMATAFFNQTFRHPTKTDFPIFDSRVFNVPVAEVNNVFLWRQQDCTRNSINCLGQSQFSHKQLQGKSTSQVQDMLMLEKGINWNDLPTKFKRGTCIKEAQKMVNGRPRKFMQVDYECPIFSQDVSYIESHLKRGE